MLRVGWMFNELHGEDLYSKLIVFYPWNLKVRCRVNKSPPLVPVLIGINSVDAFPSCFLNTEGFTVCCS